MCNPLLYYFVHFYHTRLGSSPEIVSEDEIQDSLKTSSQLLADGNAKETPKIDEEEEEDETPEIIVDTVNLEKEEENGTKADDEMSSDEESIATVKHIDKVGFYFLDLL